MTREQSEILNHTGFSSRKQLQTGFERNNGAVNISFRAALQCRVYGLFNLIMRYLVFIRQRSSFSSGMLDFM